MNVTLNFPTFHPAISRAIAAVGADESLILAAVNEELAKVKVEVDDKNKDSEAGGKVTFESRLKVKSAKNDATPALRLTRVQRWLCQSAELYLRVETVELPKSIDEWLRAGKFAKVQAPAPATS